MRARGYMRGRGVPRRVWASWPGKEIKAKGGPARSHGDGGGICWSWGILWVNDWGGSGSHEGAIERSEGEHGGAEEGDQSRGGWGGHVGRGGIELMHWSRGRDIRARGGIGSHEIGDDGGVT